MHDENKPEHVRRGRRCRDCGEPVVPTSYWFCRLHVVKTKDWEDSDTDDNEFFERIRTAKKKAMS